MALKRIMILTTDINGRRKTVTELTKELGDELGLPPEDDVEGKPFVIDDDHDPDYGEIAKR